jgi:membrane protease YdiL (CAAX protease family)
VGWRWIFVAVVAAPLIHLTGVGLALAWGGRFPFHLAQLALLVLFFPVNLGEEIGWRGYALPKLQERFSPFSASLIVGAAWAAFHLFALLANPTQPWLYFLVGSALLLAISVIMTQIFNRTEGSALLMALLHAMYDTVSIAVSPLIETGVPLMAFGLSAGVAWLVVAAMLALGQIQRMSPSISSWVDDTPPG